MRTYLFNLNDMNNIEKCREIAHYLVEVMKNNNLPRNKEFDEWIKNNSSAFEVLKYFTDEEALAQEIMSFHSEDKEEGANELFHKITKKQRKGLFIRISSVAAVLFFTSFGVWHITTNSTDKNLPNTTVAVSKLTENVKIVLENGEEIELSDELDTIKTNNLFLHKNGVNTIALASTDDTVSMNRLVVPKRKVYSIVLSDGTKVMLNAESKLTFPNQFTGATREVSIEGEGYFEVAKNDKIPFIVHSGNVAIQVYGTKFNVKSYNKSSIKTFLMEGSVGVSVSKEPQQMLKPNQVITINDFTGSATIEDIKRTDKYIGWIDNKFVFEADSIDRVMMDLSRWYNVELELKDNAALDVLITGSFRRDSKLDEIIETLEIISGVKLIKKDF